jgi:histidyl-tRNA synthetase
MKAADRSGAAYAVIIGTDELDAGTVVVRPLRADYDPATGAGGQQAINRNDLLPHLQKALS